MRDVAPVECSGTFTTGYRLDAFTQIDVKLSDRHSITGTLSVFLTDVDNMGIDSLHPALATPDTETDGWNVAIADELATGPNTLWQTQFALRGG